MDTIWDELTWGLDDHTVVVRVVVRLVSAMLLGAVVGYERERAGQWAGLRTHMLVALGSALLVVVPSVSNASADAISRVVQGIVTGIGFIGAGSVLKLTRRREIRGLTTAAAVWVTAAVGVVAGLGYEGVAALAIGLAWGVLTAVGRLETHFIHERARINARERPRPSEPDVER